MQIGDPFPTFSLKDIHGAAVESTSLFGKIIVMNFWSAECPWSEKVDQQIGAFLNQWGKQIRYVCVAANINETKDILIETARKRGIDIVLLDQDQVLANRMDAVTTPHFFVFDKAGKLAYQGGFDDTSFRQRTPTRRLLVEAVNALLADSEPELKESPSFGCAIVRGN